MKKKLPPFVEKFAKLDKELYSSVSRQLIKVCAAPSK